MKVSLLALSLVTLQLATGCISRHVISGPPLPKALAMNKKQYNQYVMNEIANFYGGKCLQENNPIPYAKLQVARSTNCGTDREKRDQIMYDLKGIVDQNYDEYARNFQQTADTISFAGEVGSTTLSAVGTLVGATDLKDILSTASTLTQSTNVGVQKNFFQKQSEYAILAAMDAARLQKWSNIAVLLKNNDVNTYSLSQGLNDLLEYRRTGTAVAALTSIQQQAGSESVKSKEAIQNTANQPETSK